MVNNQYFYFCFSLFWFGFGFVIGNFCICFLILTKKKNAPEEKAICSG